MASVVADRLESTRECCCCLCGDIGFSSDLRLCPKCGFRFQHIYCSSSYPNIDMDTWLCEWCLHDHDKKRGPKAFDFLLEIARSLPDQEPPTNASDEIKKTRGRRKEQVPEDHRRPRPTSNNPKRHKPNDRWRKPNCNSSSSPRAGIGRRYKLLADVLC